VWDRGYGHFAPRKEMTDSIAECYNL